MALDCRRAVLEELRAAMGKRDQTAEEALQLADEESALEQEIASAIQEKEAMLHEAEGEAALLESARAHLESLEAAPLREAVALEEARRNLQAAQRASDTVGREARIASDALCRMQERLAVVQRRRGEIRWQQAAPHEAVERQARSVRVFTLETLEEALAVLETKQRALLQENQPG